MTTQMMASHHHNAVVDIVTGKIAIKKKMSDILKSVKLPVGLVPVDDVVELGYNPATGFFRAIRKIKLDHIYKSINRKVTFDTEVTGIFKEHRMMKITGVKAKELMIWVSLNDFSIDNPDSGKIIFKATAGITRTFLISAFEEDEPADQVAVKATEVEVKKVVNEATTKPGGLKRRKNQKRKWK